MPVDVDLFVAEYFRVERALRDDAPRGERLWNEQTASENAWGQLDDLVYSVPTDAWRLILILIERAPDAEVLDFVAAGPLEDFVHEQGATFHQRIADEARANTRLRTALNAVWRWHTLPIDVRSALMPFLDPQIRAYWDARRATGRPQSRRCRSKRPSHARDIGDR